MTATGQSDKIAAVMKPIARYMEETGMGIDQLVTAAGLDAKLVKAIVSGNYTPSPAQRKRLAGALGVSTDDISWGHAVEVEHMRGNGPQCGRST
jgi:ribosome-binding protein aMBF1 (putative translation factor)